MSNTKFTIIRDTRENKGWNFRASANCSGVVERKLDVGDYAIEGLEDKVHIERKAFADLWNTLSNQKQYKRFIKEWERAKPGALKYLIIEASIADIDKGFTWYQKGGNKRRSKTPSNNIHAKLISLQVKYNVHVIFAGRHDKARSYARFLMSKLWRYHLEGIL